MTAMAIPADPPTRAPKGAKAPKAKRLDLRRADVEALHAAGKLDRITPAQWVRREKVRSAARFARRAAALQVTVEEAQRRFRDELRAHVTVGRDGQRWGGTPYAPAAGLDD